MGDKLDILKIIDWKNNIIIMICLNLFALFVWFKGYVDFWEVFGIMVVSNLLVALYLTLIDLFTYHIEKNKNKS